MLQRDYLMRRIEEMMQLIALALKFRHDGNFGSSEEAIAKAYEEVPNLTQERIATMTPKELLAYFLKNDLASPNFIDMVANILQEEGEVFLLQGDRAKGKDCFAKALELYQYVDQHSTVFSFDRLNKIRRIKEELKVIE